MADHTITIANTLTFFGGKPAQEWGAVVGQDTMTWGTSNWGTKGDFQEIVVTKLLTNSLTMGDAALAFAVTKELTNSLSLADGFTKEVGRTISESLTVTSDPSSETLQDPAGYYYVFTKPTSNAETRVETSYTSASAGSASFTSLAGTSTTWS